MNEKAVFLQYIRAYNRKDVESMLSFFDENCVFENVSAGKATVHTTGKAELKALAEKSAAAFAWREQKVVLVIREPDRLAAEIEYHGVLQLDLTPELKAGTRLELRGVSVVEFSGQKIIRLTDYS